MKKIVFIILAIANLFLFKINLYAQWPWANHIHSNSYDDVRGICKDPSDNIYVTGYYENLYLTFGSVTLTNAGGNSATRDIFLVKYDSSGSVLWARGAGGISHEESFAVSKDALAYCPVM